MSEIKIIPLGTVSPYCKGNMNCPGYLVKYNEKNILLDCGNGITRLMNFPDDLFNLSVIITHYHKDHLGDIGTIQYTSYVYRKLLEERGCKVDVYLPKNDVGYIKKSILCVKESYCNYFDIDDNYSFNVDDLKLTFSDNKSHTIKSYVVKLENDDFKIVYTSDVGTSNFSELVDFCKDSDLLICESSFLRKHYSNSTVHMRAYDAGVLAKGSNSKKLLLTHFWPDEDKKLYLAEAMEVFENTEAAEEGKCLVLRR